MPKTPTALTRRKPVAASLCQPELSFPPVLFLPIARPPGMLADANGHPCCISCGTQSETSAPFCKQCGMRLESPLMLFEAGKTAQTTSESVQADRRKPLRILRYLTHLSLTLPSLAVSCSGSQVSCVAGAAITSGSFRITKPLDHVVSAINLTPNAFEMEILIVAVAVF